MSEAELIKKLQEMRGTPITIKSSPPKPKIKPEIRRKREELKIIRFAQAPPPLKVKSIGEAQKAIYYYEQAINEANRRTAQAQINKKQLQNQLQTVMRDQSKYDQSSFTIYVNKAQEAIKEHDKYLDETNQMKQKIQKNLSSLKDYSTKIRETKVPKIVEPYPEVERIKEREKVRVSRQYVADQVKQTKTGKRFINTLPQVKSINLIGKIYKEVKDLIKYSREQFIKGNYPSEIEYKEWIKTATPDELLGPTPFTPKTTEEAVARAKFSASQGLVGAFKEATFPFSWRKYQPQNVYEATAQIGGALLTPTPQDYIIGKIIGKAIGKVEDVASAINEYRLTKKLGKGWEYIPDEVGDAWFRIGEGYGIDIPEQAVKDLLKAHKTGQYVSPTQLDEWVSKHLYSAGAGYYPFPELVNVPREGLTTDPRLLAELNRLREIAKIPIKDIKKEFIGPFGSIPLTIELLNKEKKDLLKNRYPSNYIEQRRKQIIQTINKLRDLEKTIETTPTKEVVNLLEKIALEVPPLMILETPKPKPIIDEETETIPAIVPIIEPITEPIITEPITKLSSEAPTTEHLIKTKPLTKIQKKRIRSLTKPISKEITYTVKFTDYDKRTESIEIPAKTFQEAYSKAFHIRRWHGLLHIVDIIKRG
ncbi:MAG: hypothetical protein ACFFDT_24055 [Candidatus Hodarchaeota archaeon]